MNKYVSSELVICIFIMIVIIIIILNSDMLFSSATV